MKNNNPLCCCVSSGYWGIKTDQTLMRQQHFIYQNRSSTGSHKPGESGDHRHYRPVRFLTECRKPWLSVGKQVAGFNPIRSNNQCGSIRPGRSGSEAVV